MCVQDPLYARITPICQARLGALSLELRSSARNRWSRHRRLVKVSHAIRKIKKVLEHGTTKPIVARLSLQILEILKQCSVSKGYSGQGRRSVHELAAQDTAALLGDRALSPFASVCGALCDFGSSFNLFDPASLFQQPEMLRACSLGSRFQSAQRTPTIHVGSGVRLKA